MTFKERYGPVALVAGASKGLGAAFSYALAREGFNLVIVVRDDEGLKSAAWELTSLFPIEVWPVCCDLNDQDATERIQEGLVTAYSISSSIMPHVLLLVPSWIIRYQNMYT